jgi:tripartite-type tricarboxylate transporter receptor subunit TctC
MKIPRRRFLRLTAGVAALPAISPIARAQTFPSRPITIVVGYAAGGPTDTVARILAERMKTVLGQPVLVENATGAGGSIAVGRVVRAAPDGYTVSIGDMGNYIANQALYPLQ